MQTGGSCQTKGQSPKLLHWRTTNQSGWSTPSSHWTRPYWPRMQLLQDFICESLTKSRGIVNLGSNGYRGTSRYMHLQSQSLFAKRAEHCRTVAQSLIAFSPITPSISATMCGSGGVFDFHGPRRPSKVSVGKNLSQTSFVANSCKFRWYSLGSLYRRKSCQHLTLFRSHQIFQIFTVTKHSQQRYGNWQLTKAAEFSKHLLSVPWLSGHAFRLM